MKEDFEQKLMFKLANLTFHEGTAQATSGKGVRHSIAQGIKMYCEKYNIPQDSMPFLRTIPRAALMMCLAGVSQPINLGITMLMTCCKLKHTLDSRENGSSEKSSPQKFD